MNTERWREIDRLFEAALDLDPSDREGFLERECADDEVRRAVHALLAAHERTGDFLSRPALEVAARAGAAPERSLVGQQLGPYKVLDVLGRGGMGEVYRARDARLDRDVAIKVLPAALSGDAERLRRFEQEARAAGRLNHPNVLTIHDVGTHEGAPYLVSELLAGETLRARLERGPLSPDEAADCAAQIARGLAAAHEKGVVHRDVKPENLFVTQDGPVKILDFGIAKLTWPDALPGAPDGTTEAHPTASGVVLGTASYMSPEQVRGEPIDGRSDLFSLGAVLYEMATGELAFRRKAVTATMAAILYEDPGTAEGRARIPKQLERPVQWCLEKDLEHRCPSPTDLIDALAGARTAGLVRTVVAPSAGRARSAVRSVRLVAALALVLGLGAATLWFRDGAEQPAAGPEIRTLAVLPFKPLDPAGRDPYLELGMADTLITRLGNVRTLVVRPTSAVRRFVDAETDPAAAGQELRVDAVLEGSVQRAGDRVRVTVRLVRVADSALLWAQQFDEEFTNVFGVQDAIAAKVASALALQLSSEERARLERRPTENAEAFELYLKGRYFLDRRTPMDVQKAIDYFRQAVERDPNLALAHAGISDSYTLLGTPEAILGGSRPRETFPQAKAAALRALELDPDLAESHRALAHISWNYDWDWPKAEAEFRRSIELSPNDAGSHHLYAFFLASRGRAEAAVAEARLAAQLEPVSLIINANYAYVLYRARRFDEAIEQCRTTLELDPSFAQTYHRLGLAYEAKGMYAEATSTLERAVALAGGSEVPLSALGHAYAAAGRTDDARRVLDQLFDLSRRRFVSPYHVAAVYAGLGDEDQAFLWLDRALEERIGELVNLEINPQFDALRTDARYADLVRRIGPER